MSATFSTWNEVKAKAAAADPRTPDEREAGQAAAAERREAYVRGHQLAEMRKAAGLTQARPTASLPRHAGARAASSVQYRRCADSNSARASLTRRS